MGKNSAAGQPFVKAAIAERFRGFLPVVIDVETGGFNADTDALLEIAAVIIGINDAGLAEPVEVVHCHVEPFPGANIEAAALQVNGIVVDHPFRFAVDEKTALAKIFQAVRAEIKRTGCNRAVLVGHNAWFDLSFLNAAIARSKIKRSPFHPFTSFDTATLGGMFYGQTVLAKAAKAAGMQWDTEKAHGALYDTEMTADLFCRMVNQAEPVYAANIKER